MEKVKTRTKPTYNVWQNSVYVIRSAWERDKIVLFVILAQILLTVGISVTAMYLPKTVVAQITGGARLETLVWTVLAFTLVTVALQAVKIYLDNTASPRRIGLRTRVCGDILVKAITTDYANLEDKVFTDIKQKAHETTNNNSTATEQVYYSFLRLGTNLLGFIVYVALLVSVNPLLLLLTAATAVFGALARRWANRWQHDHDDESAAFGKRIWYINRIGEKYNTAKDIRLFAMTDWLKDVYESNMRLFYHFHRKLQIKQFIADSVDCIASFLREGAAYAYLIWQVLYFGLPVDQFVLLFAAIGGFSGWVMGILNEYGTLSRYSLDYCRLREYLEYPEKFKREDGTAIAPEAGGEYTLELRDVSFRYKGAAENTLEHINLTIWAGEKLAVVGLNGAGKTTLVKLLCGFYDPTEGQVLLNGRDIREYNRTQYYTLFTAVFQEFNILPITVAQNVSQETEGYDENKIRRHLEQADLLEKVESLPQGIHSLLAKDVHDEAVELSGGETQKLMLARALYKDSPILILDEPTAALDSIAESRLYERYQELAGGKTSVYISHRLASTRFCDRIVLLDGKTVTECGTHEKLILRGGKYADLFAIQSKYYQEGGKGEPA